MLFVSHSLVLKEEEGEDNGTLVAKPLLLSLTYNKSKYGFF